MTDAGITPAPAHTPAPAPARRRLPAPVTVVALAALALALALGGSALGLALSQGPGSVSPTAAAGCDPTSPKLSVVGTGQATAPPDELVAVVAVNDTAGSATAALSQDNTQVTAVVGALTGNGVTRADIQTTGLTLQTQYAYPKGVPTVTGYQVTNTVTATLHHLTTAGSAIDAVVTAGGNAVQINSLTFSFADPGAVQDSARTAAVHQAVSHARTMALAAGRRLGKVCSLTDKTQAAVGNIEPLDQGFAAAGTTSAALPVPLEAGTQSESDQVTLVYALN